MNAMRTCLRLLNKRLPQPSCWRRESLPLLIVVVLGFNLVGCTSKLAQLIDKRFPPVSEESQRTAAIKSAGEALRHVHTASMGVDLSLRDLNAVPLPQDLKAQGVESVELKGDRQLLRVDLAFDRTFEGKDAAGNAEVAQVLESLRPRVKGRVTVYAGLAGELVDQSDVPVLQLKVLPAISMISVERVEVKGRYELTAAGEAIVGVLSRFKDNIAGEVGRSPLATTSVPLLSKAPIDVSQAFSVASGPAQGKVVVTANPITVPYQLEGLAWMIDEKEVVVLVQLVPTGTGAHDESPVTTQTFETIREAFKTHLDVDLGLQAAKGSWVAVRKDTVAAAVNSVMAQAQVCATPAISVANQHSQNEIKLPDGLGIDCTPTTPCDLDECPFTKHPDDTRDCNQCMAYAPKICVPGSIFGPGGCTGGQCIQRWNEPTCEAAKAAQNLIYLADANGRKADCDRLALQKKAGCEIEKTATKALCETKKEALNALARTGKFANLEVNASVATKNLQVCLKDFNLSSGLDHLQLALDVQGAADATVDVKFIPLDIVGHLTCVMDWSKEQTFEASLRESRLGISADVSLADESDGFYADATVKSLGVKARLSPGPAEFLLKSPELLVKCPVLAAVAPTALTLTPFVPALRGDIDYELPEQKLRLKLALPEQTVAGQRLEGRLGSNALVLLARGSLKTP